MTRSRLSHLSRRAAAQAALDALGAAPGAHAILSVQCARGHRLAVVYATPDGMIFSAPRARQQPGQGDRWTDFLLTDEPATDDDLPGGCECGPRTLSRMALGQAIREGERCLVAG